MKIIDLHNETWKFDIRFIVCGNHDIPKGIDKDIKMEIHIALEEEANGCYLSDWNTVWLREFKLSPHHIGTLAHECEHVVRYIMGCRGQSRTERWDDEAHAYLMEWLIKSFIKEFKRQ